MRTFYKICVVGIVVFIAFVQAEALPVLDQSNVDHLPYGGVVTSIYSQMDNAQTFTVGESGTLSSVSIYVNNWDSQKNLLFDIRPAINGVPVEDNSNILASVSLPPSSIPYHYPNYHQWVPIDLTPFGLQVTEGDTLAFVLRSTTSYGNEYGGSGNQMSYTGGDLFLRIHYGNNVWEKFAPDAGTDLFFRTYVEPSVVPEPSTLLLLGAGIAGVIAFRKRLTR